VFRSHKWSLIFRLWSNLLTAFLITSCIRYVHINKSYNLKKHFRLSESWVYHIIWHPVARRRRSGRACLLNFQGRLREEISVSIFRAVQEKWTTLKQEIAGSCAAFVPTSRTPMS
jgi:hypothetical protein